MRTPLLVFIVLVLALPGIVLAQAGNADYNACKQSVESKEAQAKAAQAAGQNGAAAAICESLMEEKVACAAKAADLDLPSPDSLRDWQDKITDNMFMCCEAAIEDLKQQSANAKTPAAKAAIEDKILEKVLECQQFSQSGLVDEGRAPPVGRIGGSDDSWSKAGFDAWVKSCEEKLKDADEKIKNAKNAQEMQQAVEEKMKIIYECLSFGYSGLVSEGSQNVTDEIENLWKRALITTLMDCQERLKNAKTQEEREKILKECTEKVDDIPNYVKGQKLKDNPWEALINLGGFSEDERKALKTACDQRVTEIEAKIASATLLRWEKEKLEKSKQLIEDGCLAKLGVDTNRLTIDRVNIFADTYNKNLDKVPSVIKNFFSTLKINFILRSSKGEKIVLVSMRDGKISDTTIVKEPQKAEMTMALRQITMDEITGSKDIAGEFLKALVDGRISRDIYSPTLLLGFGAIDGVGRSQNPPSYTVRPGETKSITYLGSPATLTSNPRGTVYVQPAQQNYLVFVNPYGVDYGYGNARSQTYLSYNTNSYSANAGIYMQPPQQIYRTVQRQPVSIPYYSSAPSFGYSSSYQSASLVFTGAARGAAAGSGGFYRVG